MAILGVARRARLGPQCRTMPSRIAGLLVTGGGARRALLPEHGDRHPETSLSTVWSAITAFDPTNTDHLVIMELRLPRTILGLLVGAALGLAGAVMQGVTRNPLADPGILGVNAGAALFVVIAISVFGITSVDRLRLVRLRRCRGGDGRGLQPSPRSGREGATPIKLALAGAAVSAALGAVTTSFLLMDEATFDQFRFWQVGTLAGRDLSVVGAGGAVPDHRFAARAVPGPGAEHALARRGRGPRPGRQRRCSRG